MKTVKIVFINREVAIFQKVTNYDEVLGKLNSQRKFFEVTDEIEGTYIYKVSDVDFISIK